MRHVFPVALVLLLGAGAWAQTSNGCSCGSHPPGRPEPRSSKPYAGTPEDLRPYSKFTTPYYEHYTDLLEYNGAARDVADPTGITEVRIGFLGPIENHPDQVFGRRMLNGATLAIDEANAAGGYCGKPFRLMLHNDSAIWGAASNEIVKMVYDDKVWAMFGSISSDTTHIALRVSLKAELPIVNSASTDPTIPETLIPWYFTDIQDDRVQGYTLARHIYTELGLKRIALLRVNNRYGRFGVIKFRDASRRLGHPVVIEQKFQPGDADFGRQLRVIQDSGVDGIVLWTDAGQAAMILKQMQELGMKQRVFGSHRTIGDELIKTAGTAAEGFEAVYPYDPNRHDQRWADFNQRFEARFHEKPDHFAALAYDAMQVLLDAICRAGLNKGRIRDALTGVASYKGVTGDMVFDPNCKNVSPMFLASVHHGTIEYRRITMEKPYARVGEDGVQYAGPQLPDEETQDKETQDNGTKDWRIAVFGAQADLIVRSQDIRHVLDTLSAAGHHFSLIGIPSEGPWGRASSGLVQAVYQDQVLGIIATDRNASHLAEQIGTKAFVPVIAISSDRMLTSTNVPWIFRLPQGTPLEQALRCLAEATNRTGPNRGRIREVLASGIAVAGMRFQSTGELK